MTPHPVDLVEMQSSSMAALRSPEFQRVHGVDLVGGYRSAEHQHAFAGDFHDVLPGARPEDETLVVLGDVCGRGALAAGLARQIRCGLRAIRPLADNHAGVLDLLNRAMLSDDNSRFATLVLASFRREEDRVVLELTCAGHPPPLILRRNQTVERAPTRGTLVGALPQFKVRSWQTFLFPGDVCLLYTDGVTEARGGASGTEVFGEARFAATLRQGGHGTRPEDLVERVLTDAANWADQRLDDMAVVAIGCPLAD